jgi:hypothetical protein
MPIECPAGYICNDEALIIPTNVCRIGHICRKEVMSGLLSIERSCQLLVTIDEEVICDSRIFYQKFINKIREVDLLTTDDEKLYNYFENADVCCWN